MSLTVGEIITRLRNTIDGYSEDRLEVLDPSLFYSAIGQAVLDLRQELKLPVSEKDLTVLSGKRGMNLPSDWLEFLGEPTDMRIDPDGQNSEGDWVRIVPETDLAG